MHDPLHGMDSLQVSAVAVPNDGDPAAVSSAAAAAAATAATAALELVVSY